MSPLISSTSGSFKLGQDQVQKIYLGSAQVWASSPPPPSGPPTFIAGTGFTNSTGGFTLAWPAGAIANDIGIIVAESSGDDSTISITTSSGWEHITGSPIVDVADATGSKLQILWKRHSGSETNPVLTDPGDHLIAGMFLFRGCASSGNPWNSIATDVKTVASTTASPPSVTTTADNCLIVFVVGRPDDNISATQFGLPSNNSLSSITELTEGGTDDGNGGGIQVSSGIKELAGNIGETTIVKSNSTTDTYATIALR